VGCHWYGGHLEDYVKAFGSADGKEGAAGAGSLPGGISSATHKLVYLSADAEEELETLKEDEVYIIGGIVDHNRYKVSLALCPTVPRDQADAVESVSDQSRETGDPHGPAADRRVYRQPPDAQGAHRQPGISDPDRVH
jgi:hypothetical protein